MSDNFRKPARNEVLFAHSFLGHLDIMADLAIILGYGFFDWNGTIYAHNERGYHETEWLSNSLKDASNVENDGVTPEIVGKFVDEVVEAEMYRPQRTSAAVAGRLIEEVTELGLTTGLSGGEILMHVTDSLHNQALKASAKQGATVFPSLLDADKDELPQECADVGILLKDLCYVAGVDLADEEAKKWQSFTKKTFRVGPKGTIYAVKSHIK